MGQHSESLLAAAEAENQIVYRPLRPADLAAMQVLHSAMFPIDYDHSFFSQAVHGDILGWTAVVPQLTTLTRFPTPTTVFVEGKQMVGFVTAKPCAVHEISPADRRVLGLEGAEHSAVPVMYILTLGVVEEFRRRGVAGALLELVEERAVALGCIVAYLHVITYNEAAIEFYRGKGFQEGALLRDFYYIQTGRALHPDKCEYDACLFGKHLHPQRSSDRASPLWGYLDGVATWAPLRHFLGSCMSRRNMAYSSKENRRNRRHRGGDKWLWSLFRTS